MTPADIFSDVIRSIARYDAGFPARVRGAADDDIRRHEALSGAPAPEIYRAFLAAMGHDPGGLTPLAASPRLPDVLASLARRRPPPGYCLIAVQDNHPHLDVYLDVQAPELTPGAGPPVVRFEAGANIAAPDRASAPSAPDPDEEPVQIYPAYPSLPDMIVSTAFARFRVATLPHRAYLVPSGPTWPEERRLERPAILAALAARQSFTRLLHTSLQTACYDKPTAAMQVYSPHDLSFSIELAATTRKALEGAIETLREPLSLVEERVS